MSVGVRRGEVLDKKVEVTVRGISRAITYHVHKRRGGEGRRGILFIDGLSEEGSHGGGGSSMLLDT